MDGSGDARELAAVLARLKQRSGLSYQELARRTFTSSSTLHRYCRGTVVPGDFGIVARIAEECAADPDDLARLVRCWQAITRPAPPAGPPPGDSAPADSALAGSVPVKSVLADPVLVDSAPAPNPTVRKGVWRDRLGRVACALVAVLVVTVASAAEPAFTAALDAEVSAVPDWAQAPVAVPSTAFGVTMNSDTGAMPSFRVGALRFWDSGTRWARLEPRRGEFDWTTLDRLLDGAGRAGASPLFVFGGTPGWAAPRARRAAYPDGSRAAPPDDLADWERFVRALVGHARGRIDAYEVWVMANHPHHYDGSAETLVEMTRRASRIIREAAPAATVVCPSVTGLWEPEGHEFLSRFAELGGYQHCDAAGVKLYQRRVQDPPETVLAAVRSAYRTFHRAGVHLPVWNTGTTQTLPLGDPLDERRAADHAVRFYLVGLYSRRFGVERMYFYAWGNSTLPIVLQAEGRPPTPAGLHVERLQRWLDRAEIRSCGHGGRIGMPDNVWQCEFTVPGEDGRPSTAWVRWTHAGEALTPAGPSATHVHHLDGSVTELDRFGAGQVRVAERPVLIRSTG
ncbi:helix-turn-helix domain-containing protein [Saccharothrix australiensis]|uniref:Beta-galactosidase-like protein n=1 Tax=Saccharothrix australiensis TaxID=2072 RepID=A0A495VW32_9PSEU|nr:helix-turn-helix domain-containing protein [Saccharothrix australiensis]RKT53651.1 beta-galactosidase-like protein [Saccharothrix australiensis]